MWSEHVTLEYPYHFEEVLKRLSFDPLSVIQLDEKSYLYPALYRRGTGCCSLTRDWYCSKSTVLDFSQTGRSRIKL